jgi:tetratricopeptide (TPR) repeat protein
MNKLGILYARYGLYDKAREQFGAILAGGEYAPALINEANLYWLESNLPKAREFYEQALALDSGNTTALLGMARVSHMEENYGSAREAYSRLKAIAPDLAARFAYLDQKGDDAVRAAEADRAKEVVVWQQ